MRDGSFGKIVDNRNFGTDERAESGQLSKMQTTKAASNTIGAYLEIGLKQGVEVGLVTAAHGNGDIVMEQYFVGQYPFDELLLNRVTAVHADK